MSFDRAVQCLQRGDTDGLQQLLQSEPDLATARDDSQATLLIRLIDWPGKNPDAAKSARVLLAAGAEVDARRDEENGTALTGAMCTEEIDVIQVLLEHGSDVNAPAGFRHGSALDFADDLCENLARQNDAFIQQLRQLFGNAAGRPVPQRTAIGQCTPVLFVEDVDGAITYYRDKLGFQLEWAFDEPDCEKYVCISRGGMEFHMTTCECDDKAHNGKLNVRIPCDVVDPLAKEFADKGVEFRCPLQSRPWGLREFEIIDLAGNWLTFFGPIPEDEN